MTTFSWERSERLGWREYGVILELRANIHADDTDFNADIMDDYYWVSVKLIKFRVIRA